MLAVALAGVWAYGLAATAGAARESPAAAVARNEALYRDIDVAYNSVYRLAGGLKGGELRSLDGELVGRVVLEKVTTARVVLQRGMFRVAAAVRTDTGEKEPRAQSSVHAFDGQRVRTRRGDQTTVEDGPSPLPREAYFPHLWATAPWMERFPLSARLAGGEAMEKLPDLPRVFRDAKHSSKVVGAAVVGGEPCVVVRYDVVPAARGFGSGASVYYLAVGKNYLPVRTEKFANTYSPDRPIEVVECGDLRELRPGVWLPHRVTTTVFDNVELRDAKRQVVSNTTVTTVTRASLGPVLDRSFFQDVAADR